MTSEGAALVGIARWCLALVVLATMLPLLYPPVISCRWSICSATWGAIGSSSTSIIRPSSQQYYDYHWAAIGNLGVDLLIIPLGKLLGLEPAVKLIVLARFRRSPRPVSCGLRARFTAGFRRPPFSRCPSSMAIRSCSGS